MEPVTSQFLVFVYTVLTGMLAGLLFDVYAGIARVWRLRKAGIFFGDAIYWLVVTGLVYLLLLRFNQGEVRFFVLLGLGIGAVLYFRLSQGHVRSGVVKLIEFLMRMIRLGVKIVFWILSCLLFPFRLVLIVLAFPLRFIIQLIGKMKSNLIIILKRLLPGRIKKLFRRLVKLLGFKNKE